MAFSKYLLQGQTITKCFSIAKTYIKTLHIAWEMYYRDAHSEEKSLLVPIIQEFLSLRSTLPLRQPVLKTEEIVKNECTHLSVLIGILFGLI